MADRVSIDRVLRAHPDAAAAGVLAVATAIICAAVGLFATPLGLVDALCCVGLAGLVAWRRRWPVGVAVLAGALMAAPDFTRYAHVTNGDALNVPAAIAGFLIAVALGSDCEWRRSLVGLVALGVGIGLGTGAANPITEMATIGPWLVGLLIASRRRVADELALRSTELDAEREVFAQQSVRYERAQIARELHDIVAHSVSLMVVQANAGVHLAHDDPAAAAEAFESISDSAAQAGSEIERLVEMLSDVVAPARPSGLAIVSELVVRAQSSGLRIRCEFVGDSDSISQRTADTAYRLVQEAVTNAIKHAPGAAIAITVTGADQRIELEVVNEASSVRSGLEQLGGGNGLTGMRERVARCGGRLEAGPTPATGWRVRAQLPRFPSAESSGVLT